MNTPIVLNRKKSGLPEKSVYIGRPSLFGNPFIEGIDGTRDEVINQFEQYILSKPHLIEFGRKHYKGRNLVCWCKPKPCHGDILLKLFNDKD